ncbi:MAG: PhoPQ-activated pathogenicity-related family protein [Isosphaeraceae bacterium]
MTMRRRDFLLSLAVAAGLALNVPSARADLDSYVKKDDPAYAWTQEGVDTLPGGTVTNIKLTSQVWQGITWQHQLRIIEPAEVAYPDAVLLFITGGSQTSKYRPEDAMLGLALAKLSGARVAVLPQVPNQPLLGNRKEDDLITETFVRYLDTKDEEWPLLFPMAKSAVKAMDAVQAWAKQEGKAEAKRFVVTGASKRGWTTWLTAATTDPRVVAIAPMVIDTLNMRVQIDHSKKVWGKFSEQIEDYTRRGLTEKFDDPTGKKLWLMVDPYSYRDRLTLPKLVINGANDRYWVLDSLNNYWDGLKGPKAVVYLPNAGHNLAVNRDYALNGVAALLRHTITNRPMPDLAWEHGEGSNGTLTLKVKSTPDPKSAKLWVAKAPTRDFRDSTWEAAPMVINGTVVSGETKRPEKGFIALIGDLEFEIDGVRYHLSTQVRETGAKPTD